MGNIAVGLQQEANNTSFNDEKFVELQRKWKIKFPDGMITKDEFLSEMTQLHGQTQLFWETVYALLDEDKIGKVSFHEFITGMTLLESNSDLDKKLELIFKLYDQDQNGRLEDNELDLMMDRLVHIDNLAHLRTSESSVLSMKKKTIEQLKRDRDKSQSESHSGRNSLSLDRNTLDKALLSPRERQACEKSPRERLSSSLERSLASPRTENNRGVLSPRDKTTTSNDGNTNSSSNTASSSNPGLPQPQSEGLTLEEFKSSVRENTDLCARIEKFALTSDSWVEKIVEINAKEAESFQSQAGGHTGAKGLLQEEGFVFKHYSNPEYQAYEKFKEHPEMQALIPAYGGRVIRTNPVTGESSHYLKLKDLTYGMAKPCVMDCKMGLHTYEEDANISKKLFQGTADHLSTTSELGFRICGLKCYQLQTNSFVTKDKSWGVKLTSATITPFLKTFVQNGVTIRYDVIKAMIPELQKIADWFAQETSFKFYGSSILFVYDGANVKEANVVVKMVDFAHVVDTVDGTKDLSYATGLQTLISTFSELVKEGEHAEKIDTCHVWQKYTIGAHLCTMCSKYIWMARSSGFVCKECGVRAHTFCMPLFPPNCAQERANNRRGISMVTGGISNVASLIVQPLKSLTTGTNTATTTTTGNATD